MNGQEWGGGQPKAPLLLMLLSFYYPQALSVPSGLHPMPPRPFSPSPPHEPQSTNKLLGLLSLGSLCPPRKVASVLEATRGLMGVRPLEKAHIPQLGFPPLL